MAVLRITKVPEPVLRVKTSKVRKIDASIQKLIDDMIETMHDAQLLDPCASASSTSRATTS